MADPTPTNNQLIEYRLDELKELCGQILSRLDDHATAFNNHVKDDAIVAERLAQIAEERKSNAGLWSGLGGAAAGAGAFLYALFGGAK